MPDIPIPAPPWWAQAALQPVAPAPPRKKRDVNDIRMEDLVQGVDAARGVWFEHPRIIPQFEGWIHVGLDVRPRKGDVLVLIKPHPNEPPGAHATIKDGIKAEDVFGFGIPDKTMREAGQADPNLDCWMLYRRDPKFRRLVSNPYHSAPLPLP